MKKEDVRYILKHMPSGMYLKDTHGREFTTVIKNARAWQPNQKADDDYARDLYATGDYVWIKETTTTAVEYEEVNLDGI